jgi:hypothetical protein
MSAEWLFLNLLLISDMANSSLMEYSIRSSIDAHYSFERIWSIFILNRMNSIAVPNNIELTIMFRLYPYSINELKWMLNEWFPPIGYFQQVRRYRETCRFWSIWRPHNSQFLCNYMGELTSFAFYGQNGSVNMWSNRLFLNANIFPVLKKLFLFKSNSWIASCPYFQWEKIDKLFKTGNFNLVRPTPVLQLVPLENTRLLTYSRRRENSKLLAFISFGENG